MPDTQPHLIEQTTIVIDENEDIRHELEECNESISTLNIELNECRTQEECNESISTLNIELNECRTQLETLRSECIRNVQIVCPNFFQKCLPLIIIIIIMIIISLYFIFKKK
tara:strand:+ start:3184 stop:3519 length:336 start_codon:yes stop_codon:yes gene_type:complete